MARINIDDSFFCDERFRLLVRIIGDEDKALGMMVHLWRIAQMYWAKDRGLIPKRIFELGKFEHVIEVGLAEQMPHGIIVCKPDIY
jgi:hypothetical protein